MKQPIREADYLEMGKVLRRQILQYYNADSCIATSRATLNSLRDLKVDAYPLACSVVIINLPVMEWTEEHGRFPEAHTDEYPEGGYAMSIGWPGTAPSNPGDWVGHLVVISERKWLLDFSIDQASRSQFGNDLDRVLVVPVTEKFLRGKEPVVYRQGDTFLYYFAHVGERGFETSPNWSGVSAPTVHIRRRETR